jgi:hypothetical protein
VIKHTPVYASRTRATVTAARQEARLRGTQYSISHPVGRQPEQMLRHPHTAYLLHAEKASGDAGFAHDSAAASGRIRCANRVLCPPKPRHAPLRIEGRRRTSGQTRGVPDALRRHTAPPPHYVERRCLHYSLASALSFITQPFWPTRLNLFFLLP